MRCSDKDCGLEFDRCDAELSFETFLTEPDSISDPEVEFHLDTTVEFLCPDCGSPVEKWNGETRFTVEMAES